MPLSISNESKNYITITNEDKKDNNPTWDEADLTWDEATGTWEKPRTPITKEVKNTITITNENKN